MPQTRPIETPAYASLFQRAAAYGLDVAGLAGAIQISQFALGGAVLPAHPTGWQVEAFVLFTVSLPIWLYFIVSEAGWGATAGKWILGLQVTRLDGGRLNVAQAILRTAVKLIPWELTHLSLLLPTPIWSDPQPGLRPGLIVVYGLLGLYLAVMGLNPRRQSVDDLVARSLVRQRRPSTRR